MKRFLIVLTLVAVLGLPGAGRASPAYMPATYLDIMQTIAKAKGSVILVNFWATWCAPCRMELPGLVQLRKDFPEDKLKIYGVSVDQHPSALDSFLKQMPLNYSVLWATVDALRGFGISAVPRTMVFDRDGKLALQRDGYMDHGELKTTVQRLVGN
jgi:thiol-disulfide isomerase/thioredoxin